MRVEQRRPLVGIVLAFMSGILSAHIAGGMFLATWMPVVACVSAGWLAFLVQRCFSGVRWIASVASCFSIFLSVFFFGYAMDPGAESAARRTSMVSILQLAQSGETVRISGTVSSHPEMRDLEDSGRRICTFKLSPCGLQAGAEARTLNGVTIRCNLFGLPGARNPRYGERWEFTGRLRAFPPLNIDEIEFLKKDGVSRHGRKLARLADRFYVSGGMKSARFMGRSVGSGLKQRIYAARAAGSDLLGLGVDDFPLSVSITRALLLGYRSGVPPEVRSLFAETGTLHVFAISGLHVGIVAAIIVFVMSAAKIPRTRWFFVLAPSLGLYIVSTGASPSAVRAGIMALAYFAAYLIGRKGDTLSALALSALVILVISPGRMTSPGFIFSFVVVSGLLAIYPLFHVRIRHIVSPDPLRLEPERWWKRALSVGCGYCLSVAGLSVSAWLVSAPLSAVFFQTISPVALLGNVFVTPLTFLIVLTASLSVVCGSVAGFIGSILNHANVAFTSVLIWLTGGIHSLPLATLKVDRPPIGIVVGWYLLLAVVVAYMRGKSDPGPVGKR